MYSKFSYSHTLRQQGAPLSTKKQTNSNSENSSQKTVKKKDDKSDDDYDDLFMIGNKNIINNQSQQQFSMNDGDNKQRKSNKKKKIGKQEKKDRKDNKQLKRKDRKDRKEKKEKKKKKKKQQRQRIEIDSSISQNQTPLKIEQNQKSLMALKQKDEDAMGKLQRKMQLLAKFDKQLTNYRTLQQQQKILDKQFGLKQKMSQNTLAIDIIKFGQPQLFLYGIQDRQIPLYKRHPMLETIIGFKKKKKKILKILKQLNEMTNQKKIDWNKYEYISQNRYYDYEGYQNIKGYMPDLIILKSQLNKLEQKNRQKQASKSNLKCGQKDGKMEQEENSHQKQKQLAIISQNKIKDDWNLRKPDIYFNPHPQSYIKLPTRQQKLRTINQYYNKLLNAHPNNIGMWLKFLDIQDKIAQLAVGVAGLQQSEGQKNALLERKIAIIGKALQKNQLNQRLGLKYLQLLSLAKKERRLIEQYTSKLLQAHPQSEQIWKFFIEFKLSHIVDYRHSRVQKQFQEINTYLFEKRINEMKSGKQVWKIRKCGLIILSKILTVHRLQGYYQLCTAICCALLQFNIFCGPEMMELNRIQRLTRFRSYWEDYNVYKLGQHLNINQKQLQSQGWYAHSWQSYPANKEQKNKKIAIDLQAKDQEYIGSFITQKANERWLPCHSRYDRQAISNNPDSFILFEDIEFYLQTFRNIQNWELLCNIAMSNLSMPPIFSSASTASINQYEYMEQWISHTVMNLQSMSIPYGHEFSLWSRYWHPALTYQFLHISKNDSTQVGKFIYATNLVELLYSKANSMKDTLEQEFIKSIRLYLMFIFGTIYYLHTHTLQRQNNKCIPKQSNRQIIKLLKLYSKQYSLNKIREILAQEVENVKIWSMYIEYQRYAGKTIQQCGDCYVGCINAQRNNSISKQEDIVGNQLVALYELSQFMKRHDHSPMAHQHITTAILMHILHSQHQHQHQHEQLCSFQQLLSRSVALTPMDKLLIGNKLKDLLKLFNSPRYTQSLCAVYYMLLQIGQSPSSLIPLLLNTRTTMGIHILIDFGLLQYEHFQQFNILTTGLSVYDIKIVAYFSRKILADERGRLWGLFWGPFQQCCCYTRKQINYNEPIVYANFMNQMDGTNVDIYNEYIQQPSATRLFLWLFIMRVLQPEHRAFSTLTKHAIHSNFVQYFLTVAQKHLATTHQPFCISILNRLVSNPQFSFACLNQFPYCRQLYSICALSDSYKQKILRLVLQKQIRADSLSKQYN